jgi:hypothetical protein
MSIVRSLPTLVFNRSAPSRDSNDDTMMMMLMTNKDDDYCIIRSHILCLVVVAEI